MADSDPDINPFSYTHRKITKKEREEYKNLTWAQLCTQKIGLCLPPKEDADGDGTPNIVDKRPLNPKVSDWVDPTVGPGNTKLHSSIGTFSIPHGKLGVGILEAEDNEAKEPGCVCVGQTSVCAATCYNKGQYGFKPTSRASHLRNLYYSLYADEHPDYKGNKQAFENIIIKELNPFGKHVRLHVSGEFYSKKYADKWMRIANIMEDRDFNVYTRTPQLLPDKDHIPKNMNVKVSLDESSTAEHPEIITEAKKRGLKFAYTGIYNIDDKDAYLCSERCTPFKDIDPDNLEKESTACMTCWGEKKKSVVFPRRIGQKFLELIPVRVKDDKIEEVSPSELKERNIRVPRFDGKDRKWHL